MLKENDYAILYHYSLVNPCKVQVKSVDNDTMRASVINHEKIYSFPEGKPAILAFVDENNDVLFMQSILEKYDRQEHSVQFTLIGTDTYEHPERRQSERSYVSLLATFKNKEFKKYEGIVKDISYTGVCFVSDCKLELKEQLTIDIFWDTEVVCVNAYIVRVENVMGKYEYGAMINYPSLYARDAMKSQLRRLKEKNELMVRKLSGEFN